MKLKLNSPVQDLAFHFMVSKSLVFKYVFTNIWRRLSGCHQLVSNICDSRWQTPSLQSSTWSNYKATQHSEITGCMFFKPFPCTLLSRIGLKDMAGLARIKSSTVENFLLFVRPCVLFKRGLRHFYGVFLSLRWSFSLEGLFHIHTILSYWIKGDMGGWSRAETCARGRFPA